MPNSNSPGNHVEEDPLLEVLPLNRYLFIHFNNTKYLPEQFFEFFSCCFKRHISHQYFRTVLFRCSGRLAL